MTLMELPQGVWQWLTLTQKASGMIVKELERQNALLERLLLFLEDAHEQQRQREQVRRTDQVREYDTEVHP